MSRMNLYERHYHDVHPEALAIIHAKHPRTGTHVEAASRGIFAKLAKLQALRPRLVDLKEFDLRLYDQLGPRTYALCHAESRCYVRAHARVALREQMRALDKQRRMLLAQGELLVLRGTMAPGVLNLLAHTHGRRKLARNIQLFLGQLSVHLSQSLGNLGFSQAELMEMSVLAKRVEHGLVELRDESSAQRHEQNLRRAFFSLVLRSLAEVERVLQFLFGEQGATKYMPDIYVGRKKK